MNSKLRRIMKCVILLAIISCVSVISLNESRSQSDLKRVTSISPYYTNSHSSLPGNRVTGDFRKECKSTRSGIDYNGNLSNSFTGEQCLPWSLFANITNFVKGDDINYCRNYNNNTGGPWCYVRHNDIQTSIRYFFEKTDFYRFLPGNTEKQHCGIPVCGITNLLNNMYINNPNHIIDKTPLCDTASNLQLYLHPVILLFGTVLNSCAFVVFRRPAMNQSTTSLFITILAITDTLSLYFILVTNWLKLQVLNISTVFNCSVDTYFTYLTGSMSNWILVCITLERMIAVTYPHKVKVICTKKRECILAFTLSIFLSLMYIPLLNGVKLNKSFIFDSDGIDFVNYDVCYYCCLMNSIFMKLILLLIGIVVPFCLIFIGNCIIIVAMAHFGKQRVLITSSSTQSGNSHSHSLNLTLVLVCLSYLVLTFPYMIYVIVVPRMRNAYMTYSEYWCSRLLGLVSAISTMSMNFSINFLLYCIGAKRFRTEFLTMLGCNKPAASSQTAVKANSTV